jgi:hypothetical protein
VYNCSLSYAACVVLLSTVVFRSKLQQLQQLLPFVDRPCPDVPCSLSLVQTMEEVIDGTRKFGTRNR